MANEKTKKFKRIAGLIIPLVVLLITVTVTSVSFAWFSKDAEAVVEPINLTTSDVFTLTFGNVTSENTAKYNGENSYDEGFLISKRRAFASETDTGKGFSAQDETDATPAYLNYMLNKAYISKNTVKFDTDGKKIDFNITATAFEIWSRSETPGVDPDVKKYPTADALIRSAEDVPLICTWYMKKQGDSKVITPYGKIEESWFDKTGTAVSEFPWTTLPQETAEKGFTASGSDVYELYLVFAPEKFFWKQFCSEEWKQPFNEVYTEPERDKICDPANKNRYTDRPFYATPIYIGDSFEFAVSMYVTNLYDGGEL